MFLETARLQIRDFTPADFETFAILAADPEAMRFSPEGPLSRKRAGEIFQERILDDNKIYGFSRSKLLLKGTFIGWAGLGMQDVDGEKRIELGFRLFPEYWGKGLAFEAASAIMDYAFTDMRLKELISIIEPANERSIRLAERLGMAPIKKTKYLQLDVIIYGKSNPQSC